MGIFEECLKKGKWPIHWDERPYHTLRYKGRVVAGNRNMKDRFKWLELPDDMSGLFVLDMGCNAGEVSHGCYERGAVVVGFDVDRAVIRLASQVYPGPKYHVANINNYPNGFLWLKDMSFDYVLCLSIIHHVKKGKLARILKRTRWKTCVFEGHEHIYNRRVDLPRFCRSHNLPFKCEYKGKSHERLSRPLWHMWREN